MSSILNDFLEEVLFRKETNTSMKKESDENENELNEHQEQDKGVLSADGTLIPESGIDALSMILFDVSLEKVKGTDFADFAEKIVRNFIKANTKEDFDMFLKIKTISKFTDIFRY